MATIFLTVATIFLSLFSDRCQLSHAQTTDTLKPGEMLAMNTQLISTNGKFQLGFGKQSNGLFYLGIDYAVNAHNVCIANAHTPIASGNLTLGEDGTLKFFQNLGNPIILNANIAQRSIASLENSENMKVIELNVDGTNIYDVFVLKREQEEEEKTL